MHRSTGFLFGLNPQTASLSAGGGGQDGRSPKKQITENKKEKKPAYKREKHSVGNLQRNKRKRLRRRRIY